MNLLATRKCQTREQTKAKPGQTPLINNEICLSVRNRHYGADHARAWPRWRLPAVRYGEMGGNGMPKTVLIVEDNELNMKLFHDLLEAHGYNTVGTRNGIEALDLARRHRPDLILMDIQLPEVSGLEVTKWLKDDAELKAIPVVAITAFAMKGDEERIREGGCEAYLSKPISVGKFIETIRHFLGSG
jgi:two-component system, cell cycle response regulator DivK